MAETIFIIPYRWEEYHTRIGRKCAGRPTIPRVREKKRTVCPGQSSTSDLRSRSRKGDFCLQLWIE